MIGANGFHPVNPIPGEEIDFPGPDKLPPHLRRIATGQEKLPNKSKRRSVVASDRKNEDLDTILKSFSKPVLRPAQDFVKGKLYYGLALGENRVVICSDGSFFRWDDIQKDYRLLDKNFNRSSFSEQGISQWRAKKHVKATVVYESLKEYFSKFVVYKSPTIPSILALWVMGTYVYSVFRWFGYLWLNSPTRRSGKSLLMELIGYVAFNATSGTVNATEAWIFREVSANGSTLLLDELENLKNSDKDKAAAIMGLLNAGFKRDGAVGRVETQNRDHKPVEFKVYGPKCLAGINQLADTVSDRCLKISLLRKKKSEKVQRFSFTKEEAGLVCVRDNLYCFGLQYGSQIAEIYEHVDELGIPEELDDRCRDIMEPIFSIAALIDTEYGNNEFKVSDLVDSFAKEEANIRNSEDLEDQTIIHTVKALQGIAFDEHGSAILTPEELLALLRKNPELSWVENKRQAGSLMRPLSLSSKSCRVNGKVVRGYLLTQVIADDLLDRYLPSERILPDISSVTNVTSDDKSPKSIPVTKPFVTNEPSPVQLLNLSTESVNAVTDVTRPNTFDDKINPDIARVIRVFGGKVRS